MLKSKNNKRKLLNQEYSKLRKEFLNKLENNTCRASFSGCLKSTGLNLTIHHSKGRGKYYLDTSTWIPLCLKCHEFIELNPKLAKELNFTDHR